MSEARESPDLHAVRSARGPTRVGDWLLYPDLGVLRQSDTEVRLNPKSLHVLLVLLDAGDRGVSRETLLDTVWGENYPSDQVISRAMADLRAAFGERAGEQKYIRTLPKFGYQLVASSGPAGEETTRAARAGTPVWRPVGLAVVALAIALLAGVLLRVEPSADSNGSIALAGQRPVTALPGLEHQPRFVPGSDWVVHTVLRQDGGDWDLFRTSLADGVSQPVAVTAGVHEHGPAISPLGDELAYVRLANSGCHVVIQSVSFGVPTPVAGCTSRFPTLVDWSADGAVLAYTTDETLDEDGLRRLYLFNRSGKTRRRLTSAVTPTGTDFYPRFSPSGDRVAFLRGEPQPDHRSTLWVVDVGSGEETALMSQPAQVGGMTWLDDQRLLYSSSGTGRLDGFIVDVDNDVTLPIQSGEFFHPDFSSDVGLLLAAEPRSVQDLVLLSEGGSEKNVAQSTSDDRHGSLSPDEEWLAFVSRRSGFEELWIASLESDATRRLTRFDGAAVRYPDWHPDARRLIAAVSTDAGERLFEIDIVSGASTPIESEFELTTPRWLPDGNRWLAGCNDDGSWGICVGGGDAPIQRLAGGFYRPVPVDGHTFVAIDNAGALYRFSLIDGTAASVWQGLPGNGRFGWTIAGDTLYYLDVNPNGTSNRVKKRNLSTGVDVLLYEGRLPAADATVDIGERSGTLVFSRLLTSSDDIVVYDFSPPTADNESPR